MAGIPSRVRRAEPKVPIDFGGHLALAGGALQPLRPDRAVRPDVKFERLADESGLDHLNRTPQAVAGAALVPHLGGDVFLGGHAAKLTGFEDGLRERLLAVDVLAQVHRRHGCGAVQVVRSGNRDRIDGLVHFREHLAEIDEFPGLGKLFRLFVEHAGIDIANGHDVAPALCGFVHIAVTLSAHADAGYVDSAVEVLPADDGGESK